MLTIFANSFMTASRTGAINHWDRRIRLDRRHSAEIEAGTAAYRRV